jgi:hypothetical protein
MAIKKTPAKRTATKAPARKAPAAKAPAKKAPATKAPATKAPARKAAASKPAAVDWEKVAKGYATVLRDAHKAIGSVLADLALHGHGTAPGDVELTLDPKETRRAELNEQTEAALRKACVNAGYAKADVAEASKEDLVETLLNEEFSNADDDDADDDPEDEDEQEESEDDESEESEEDEDEEDSEALYTEAELREMSLAQIRKVAVDEYNYERSTLKGLDQDAIVELLTGEDESEDEGYDEDTLGEMDKAELRKIAKEEFGLTIPRGADEAKLIELILEAQEEGDEEEDDDDEADY